MNEIEKENHRYINIIMEITRFITALYVTYTVLLGEHRCLEDDDLMKKDKESKRDKMV